MKIGTGLGLLVVWMATMSLGCGKPCEALEEKLCNDLGADDCKVWKDNGKSGFPSGNRLTKKCVNALGKYDVYLKTAKQVVAAHKKAGNLKGKAKEMGEKCKAVEALLCKDLGDAACAKWKENGKPGMPDNAVRCKMAKAGSSMYKRALKAAKASTD